MKPFTLTKIEKLKLIGLCIEGATGVIGGSMIMSEAKPYLTLAILALGAVSSKIVNFIKEKENQNGKNENTNTTDSNPPV